jgi:hypothetical protein
MAEECKHKLSKIPFHLFIIILSRIIKKAIFYIFFLKTAQICLSLFCHKSINIELNQIRGIF